ncbi:hypothetical protein D4764_03G0008200 [Takifugu flavidus]|uniref:Uncharacterized protein n=1 Tax=Takifugu flavidus TaxID=433684 RepID=A0A5C6N8L1_9TELE|nr:hypothetical protein D4764_03G0008200 [Takifugu flavidus]
MADSRHIVAPFFEPSFRQKTPVAVWTPAKREARSTFVPLKMFKRSLGSLGGGGAAADGGGGRQGGFDWPTKWWPGWSPVEEGSGSSPRARYHLTPGARPRRAAPLFRTVPPTGQLGEPSLESDSQVVGDSN